MFLFVIRERTTISQLSCFLNGRVLLIEVKLMESMVSTDRFLATINHKIMPVMKLGVAL